VLLLVGNDRDVLSVTDEEIAASSEASLKKSAAIVRSEKLTSRVRFWTVLKPNFDLPRSASCSSADATTRKATEQMAKGITWKRISQVYQQRAFASPIDWDEVVELHIEEISDIRVEKHALRQAVHCALKGLPGT